MGVWGCTFFVGLGRGGVEVGMCVWLVGGGVTFIHLCGQYRANMGQINSTIPRTHPPTHLHVAQQLLVLPLGLLPPLLLLLRQRPVQQPVRLEPPRKAGFGLFVFMSCGVGCLRVCHATTSPIHPSIHPPTHPPTMWTLTSSALSAANAASTSPRSARFTSSGTATAADAVVAVGRPALARSGAEEGRAFPAVS